LGISSDIDWIGFGNGCPSFFEITISGLGELFGSGTAGSAAISGLAVLAGHE
jgi:hypothetical protein